MITAMPRRIGRAFACVGLTACAVTAFAEPRMPAGAFLRQPAPDVQSLNRQVQRDPLVCGRYARLFNMSPEMVRAAFAKMRLTRLSQDHVYAVHYVHTGETLGFKVRRVRKGTPVYVLPDGTPALVEVCGNPVRPMPTVRPHRRRPEAELAEPEESIDFNPEEAMPTTRSGEPVAFSEMRDAQPEGGFIEIPTSPARASSPSHLPISRWRR